MRWVQGWLLMAGLAAGEVPPPPPAVGEVGLAGLAAARAEVKAVAGEGRRTVQRVDEPETAGDPRRIVFAIAADGRYEVVITDPNDPAGERTRLVGDGVSAWEVSVMFPDDQPVEKRRPLAQDLLSRLLACLRLDLPALRRDYAVTLLAADGGLRDLRLVPTEPAVKAEITAISVRLDPAGKPVLVVLDEVSGNRQRLVVTTFADDPVIDPARFKGPAGR